MNSVYLIVGQSFGETDSVDYCRRNGCRSSEIKDYEVARARGITKLTPVNDHENYQFALAEAKKGRAAGGIPIGGALVVDGKIIAVGHNQRVQHGSAIHHAEMNCLENAGRLPATVYQRATMYTTLSPCDMCTGAILLYKIPRVVIGENRTFLGGEELLKSRGVEVIVLDDAESYKLMQDFIVAEPTLWNEDIGEEN